MVCEEHESAPQMYCKKCDTHVCDMCHKIDHPGHYHYLFLERPVSPDASMEEEKVTALSSAEKIKAIKEKAEQIIRQQIQERPQQEEQEIIRQKAMAAINKKKELDDAEKKT
jgi:hypothetical protein